MRIYTLVMLAILLPGVVGAGDLKDWQWYYVQTKHRVQSANSSFLRGDECGAYRADLIETGENEYTVKPSVHAAGSMCPAGAHIAKDDPMAVCLAKMREAMRRANGYVPNYQPSGARITAKLPPQEDKELAEYWRKVMQECVQ